jgi:transposase-like protein
MLTRPASSKRRLLRAQLFPRSARRHGLTPQQLFGWRRQAGSPLLLRPAVVGAIAVGFKWSFDEA